MNIPGYDAWKLSGPPQWEGPTCDWCGADENIRIQTEGCGAMPALRTCEDCFTGPDDGPCFDDLQTVAEHAQEQADIRADYLHDQARDRKGEE